MNSKSSLGCFSVNVGELKWDFSNNSPKTTVVPQGHISAWDLRTKIRDDNNATTRSGQPMELQPSLTQEVEGAIIERLALPDQLYQTTIKEFSFSEQKSEPSDSIPREVPSLELGRNSCSVTSSPCSLRSTCKQFVKRSTCYHEFYHHDPSISCTHSRCSRFSVSEREEAPLHSMLGNLRLSGKRIHRRKRPFVITAECRKLREKIIQKDRKLSADISEIAEIVPGLAKLKCHDTGEETSSISHF